MTKPKNKRRKTSKKHAVKVKPAWTRCDMCDDYVCNIHGTHVSDCPCPPIDEWDGVDPYTSRPAVPPMSQSPEDADNGLLMQVQLAAALKAKATPGPWIQDGICCKPWQVSRMNLNGKSVFVDVRENPEATTGTESEIADAKYLAAACNLDMNDIADKLWQLYQLLCNKNDHR